MDHRGEFRRAALESGIPDDEISRFTQHLRLTIGLSTGGGEGGQGGSGEGGSGARGPVVGHLGGLPRLPAGTAWPSADGTPLPLLLSVDCGALPRVDGFPLPADGTLLFFVDQEKDHEDTTGRYARVVHVPHGTETVLVEAPDPSWFREPLGVTAALRSELPLWLQERDEDEDWHEFWEDLEWDDMSPFQQGLAQYMEDELPHLDDLRTLAHDLWPSAGGIALGGYVDHGVIGHLAEQTLAGREKAGEIPPIPTAQWPTHLEKETHRLATEWISLATQGRSYEEYCTTFVIRHDDLAALRLDKALPMTVFEAP
ncbi:DUF1963 domain-containing protein [Streptomyces sp. NPDC001515]